MRIRDWSSDVCSSDLRRPHAVFIEVDTARRRIEVQLQRPRSMIERRMHKSCRRIDRARRADGNEQISLGKRLIDPPNFLWPSAEKSAVERRVGIGCVSLRRCTRQACIKKKKKKTT